MNFKSGSQLKISHLPSQNSVRQFLVRLKKLLMIEYLKDLKMLKSYKLLILLQEAQKVHQLMRQINMTDLILEDIHLLKSKAQRQLLMYRIGSFEVFEKVPEEEKQSKLDLSMIQMSLIPLKMWCRYLNLPNQHCFESYYPKKKNQNTD